MMSMSITVTRVLNVPAETVTVHPQPGHRQQPPPPPPPMPMQQRPCGYSDPAYPPGYGAPAGMASVPADPFKKAAYT